MISPASGKKSKKVGIALSGGFVRASAQIGVLEVLEENNIPIDMIAGCSSGSLVGAAYANGKLSQLKKRLIEGSRKEYWDVIFEPTIPRKGFLKGERNRKFFEEFVGDKTFVDLSKPLILTATDIESMKEVIITDGKLSRVIQACTAVPGIFVPVEIDGRVLCDGGNFNMIPSKPLYDAGMDYVIAVYASKKPNPLTRFLSTLNWAKKQDAEICRAEGGKSCSKKELNIFDLTIRTLKLSAGQIEGLYHTGYRYDAFIKPEVEHIKRWDVNSASFCIEEGRVAAMDAIRKIKKDLEL